MVAIYPLVADTGSWCCRSYLFGFNRIGRDLSIYNRESGGEVKRYKTKKFISSMTDKEDIVDAFNRHDLSTCAICPAVMISLCSCSGKG